MSIAKFIRHHRQTVRKRIGLVKPDQSYLFELILLVLLVLLVVLGIGWM